MWGYTSPSPSIPFEPHPASPTYLLRHCHFLSSTPQLVESFQIESQIGADAIHRRRSTVIFKPLAETLGRVSWQRRKTESFVVKEVCQCAQSPSALEPFLPLRLFGATRAIPESVVVEEEIMAQEKIIGKTSQIRRTQWDGASSKACLLRRTSFK